MFYCYYYLAFACGVEGGSSCLIVFFMETASFNDYLTFRRLNVCLGISSSCFIGT